MDSELRELERRCAASPSTRAWGELARARLRAGQVFRALEAVRGGYLVDGGDAELDDVRGSVLVEWWKAARWRELFRSPLANGLSLGFSGRGDKLGMVSLHRAFCVLDLAGEVLGSCDRWMLDVNFVEDDALGRRIEWPDVVRINVQNGRVRAEVRLDADPLCASVCGKRGVLVFRGRRSVAVLDFSKKTKIGLGASCDLGDGIEGVLPVAGRDPSQDRVLVQRAGVVVERRGPRFQEDLVPEAAQDVLEKALRERGNALSPDGRAAVWAKDRPCLATGLGEQVLVDQVARWMSAAFSPCGSRIALASDRGLVVLEAAEASR